MTGHSFDEPGVRFDDRTEILGVTLQGPNPIGVVHLPWMTGLTALYGRNGSGKSMLLRGIESAFSGIVPESRMPLPDDPLATDRSGSVFLHLRIIDPDSPLERTGTLAGHVMSLIDKSVDSLVGGYRTLGNPIGDLTEREIEDLEYRARGDVDSDAEWAGPPSPSLEIVARAHQHFAYGWGRHRRDADGVDRTNAVRQIAAMSVVSLRVTGRRQPEWQVELASLPGEQTPLFTREVDDWLRLHRFHHRWVTAMSPVERLAVALLAIRQGYESDPGPLERAEFDRLIGSIEIPDLAIAHEALHHAWNGNQDFFVENEHPNELASFQELADANRTGNWWHDLTPDDAEAVIPAVDQSLWWHLFGEPFGLQPTAEAVREGLGEPPSGLPIPLIGVASGSVEGLPQVVTFHESDAAELARATAYSIAPYLDPGWDVPESSFNWLYTMSRSPTTVETFIERAQAELVETEMNANSFLTTVWPELPDVRARVGDLRDWSEGRPVRWEAMDRPSQRWVPFDRLSAAQERWVVLAVETALAGMKQQHSARRPPVLVIDEPELALHSRSAREVADGLTQLAVDYHSAVVVASHSPAFLGRQDVSLLHVKRNSHGLVGATALRGDHDSEVDGVAAELDLDRSELLQLVDVFLMVEGEHDRIVFRGLIGDELARLNTHVLPIRGSNNLRGLIESEVVFEFTDASAVVVLDHIGDPGAVQDAWEMAVDVADRGNLSAARSIFSQGVGDGRSLNKEENEVIQFASRVLDDPEKRGRVLLTGVTEPGIEMYLNLADLGGTGSYTWESLNREWLAGPRNLDWKTWLKRLHAIDVTNETIASATERMDNVPADISSVLSVVEQARLRRQLSRR